VSDSPITFTVSEIAGFFTITACLVVMLLTAPLKWKGQNEICKQVAGPHYDVVSGVCYRKHDHKLHKVEPSRETIE
jgi:hypothetical protein